jgi:hypothetical protein
MPSPNWTRAIIIIAAGSWAAIALLSGETLKWSWVRWLGIASAALVLAVLAFDRWAWRWPGVRRLTRRPVLHGTWRAELRTSYEGRKDETIESYLVIRQTYSTVCIDMLFDRSQSTSVSGDLVAEDGRCLLYYVFRSDKQTLERDDNPPARGAAQLTVSRKPLVRLEGDYWMEHGTHGRVTTTGHTPALYDSYRDAQSGTYR